MSEIKVRLSKVMSERGICSRREADEFIRKGLVKVDGRVVSELGTKVCPRARVELLRSAHSHMSEKVTILLHKPVGFVSSTPEKGYRSAIELISATTRDPTCRVERSFHRNQLKGLAPAGRLDIDSRGLIVFTQDGRIAKQLIGDQSRIEKEYIIRVEGEITGDKIKRLQTGLTLDNVKLRPARVYQRPGNSLKIILTEGRKRQVRRMCESVGLKVTSLNRVRIGNIKLGPLKKGQWRYLKPNESF